MTFARYCSVLACALILAGGLLLRFTPTAKAQVAPSLNTIEDAHLSLTFDPTDANDSEFLKHILLSHGLELTLRTDNTLGLSEYHSIINPDSQIDQYPDIDYPDAYYETSSPENPNPLLRDVTDQFVLSLFAEAPDTLRTLPASARVPNRVPNTWKVIWWLLDKPADHQQIPPDAYLPTDAPHTHPAQEAQSLFHPSAQDTFSLLAERLRSAGLEVGFGDQCKPVQRVKHAVDQWLERGIYPLQDGGPRHSGKAMVDVYDEGVTRQWRVIWLECADGVTLVKLPDIKPPEKPKDFNPPARAPMVRRTSDELMENFREQTSAQAQPESAATDSARIAQQKPSARLTTTTPAPSTLPIRSPFDSARSPTDNIGSTSPFSAENTLTLNDDVPEGFEALAEPQYLFIDVYFNERLLGSTGIMATADEITFDNPAEVATYLQPSVPSENLTQWLSAALPTNGHLACLAPGDPVDCGQVEADPLAVIYNAALLRVDLYVNQNEQVTNAANFQRHLPSPALKRTAILSTYAIVSDFSGEKTSADLSARALLGYGRGHFNAELDYNNRTERSRLRELKWTHHLRDHEVIAGTYPLHSGGSLNDIDLLGAGISTSYKTRVDLENAFSSQLVIFLPRRSIVQLVVDDRVYAGDSYEAGNQSLDTSALPDGTYEVEIRIIDPGNGPRTERRVFTKSTQIPPAGESVIKFAGGLVRDRESESTTPEASRLGVFAASITRRINDQAALQLGIMQYDNDTLLQTSLTYLGPSLSFQATASVGESDVRAASMQAGWEIDDLNIGLTARHFSSSRTPLPDSIESTFYLPDYSQATLSLSRAFSHFSLAARSNVRLQDNEFGKREREYSHSLIAQKQLFKTRHQRGFFTSRYQHSDAGHRTELGVNVYLGKDEYNATVGASAIRRSDEPQLWQADASVGWQPRTEKATRFRANAYASASSETTSRGVRLDMAHPTFKSSAAADITTTADQPDIRNAIASFSAHLGIDNQGAGIGGSDFSQSGVVIDVDGSPRGERFDIVINSARISTGSIGKQQFIGLQPFHSYELQLVPHSLLANGVGKQNHRFTLFPGSVKRISVQARRQILLIGMIVDEAGLPLSDAVATTEDNTLIIKRDGILQAELSENEIVSIRKSDGSHCTLSFDVAPDEDVVIPDDPLICQQAPKKQARHQGQPLE